MTVKEIIEIEKTNEGKMYLYKEGIFWRVYEVSLYLFATNIKTLKVLAEVAEVRLAKCRSISTSALQRIGTLGFFFLAFNCLAQDINLKINLRGVHESKISLLPLNGTDALKPITEIAVVKNGETASISVSKDMLPAEFLLRFDYKEKETSTPYPSEKRIFIYKQNVELWTNPPYCNNSDSTWFQKDEKENTLFAQFTKENTQQKEKLGLLQNFLMNYDDTRSKFYQQGIEEYEKIRSTYNQWISERSTQYKELFVSHTFQFHHVPQIEFRGSETDRMQSVIAHYFDGIDFKDSLLINTTNLKEWMTNYVNIYGSLSVSEVLRDSLFTQAGSIACEKASKGHPKVYGWMVDYFYTGYEAYGINNGMAMLQQHINNPNCLTSKKQQIIKRLDGMIRLVPGAKAPGFILSDNDSNDFDFHSFKGTGKYKLLLFWSADCGHCQDLINKLATWYNTNDNKEKLDIIAVSLDETETEVQQWENAIIDLPGWKHLRTKEGINSAVANNYAILSTPVMFLVGSENNIIVSVPIDFTKLIEDLRLLQSTRNESKQ